jgi:hypothetical protein
MDANDPIHQNSNFLAKRGRPHMDFGLERSVIGPALVERQRLFGDPAPSAFGPCGGGGGGGRRRSNRTKDPNHVTQETIIKQSPLDGLKAGSGGCDAPQQTGRDHCHHDGGNWLAAPFGAWLFDSGGAQKTRPDTLVREAWCGSTGPAPSQVVD